MQTIPKADCSLGSVALGQPVHDLSTPSPRPVPSVSPTSEAKQTPPSKSELLKKLLMQRDQLEALMKLKQQRAGTSGSPLHA